MSPNRATRIIANAELYNPPFVRPPSPPSRRVPARFGLSSAFPLFQHVHVVILVTSCLNPLQNTSPVRVSGRGAVRQTISSAGNSVNYTLTAALQNPRMQQPPVRCMLRRSSQQRDAPLPPPPPDQLRLPQAHPHVYLAKSVQTLPASAPLSHTPLQLLSPQRESGPVCRKTPLPSTTPATAVTRCPGRPPGCRLPPPSPPPLPCAPAPRPLLALPLTSPPDCRL
jgi:hypothetical protein